MLAGPVRRQGVAASRSQQLPADLIVAHVPSGSPAPTGRTVSPPRDPVPAQAGGEHVDPEAAHGAEPGLDLADVLEQGGRQYGPRHAGAVPIPELAGHTVGRGDPRLEPTPSPSVGRTARAARPQRRRHPASPVPYPAAVRLRSHAVTLAARPQW
jgi:hypothetical protein